MWMDTVVNTRVLILDTCNVVMFNILHILHRQLLILHLYLILVYARKISFPQAQENKLCIGECKLMTITSSLRPEIISTYFLFPRFWDLAYPERSYIVAGGTSSSSVSYSRKIIEGTEVVQVQAVLFSLNFYRHTNDFGQEWQYLRRTFIFFGLFCDF